MYCSNCGESMDQGDGVCTHCGHTIDQVLKTPPIPEISKTTVPPESNVQTHQDAQPPVELVENYGVIYAGFWKRLGAFIVDALCLGVIGFILCLLFFNTLVSLADFCFIIGAVISGAYFVLLLGKVGEGQTLGKKLMKIRVVATNGDIANYKHTTLRFLVFNAFFLHYVLGIAFLRTTNHLALLFVQLLYVIPTFMFLMVYGLVLFHKQKKGFHDLVAGTCVIKTKFQKWYIPENKLPYQQHLLYRVNTRKSVMGAFCSFAGILTMWCIFSYFSLQKTGVKISDLLEARVKIQNETGAVIPSITQNVMTVRNIGEGEDPQIRKFISITIRSAKSREELSTELDKMKAIIESYSSMSDHDIRITLLKDVDIGISKLNKSESFILDEKGKE